MSLCHPSKEFVDMEFYDFFWPGDPRTQPISAILKLLSFGYLWPPSPSVGIICTCVFFYQVCNHSICFMLFYYCPYSAKCYVLPCMYFIVPITPPVSGLVGGTRLGHRKFSSKVLLGSPIQGHTQKINTVPKRFPKGEVKRQAGV